MRKRFFLIIHLDIDLFCSVCYNEKNVKVIRKRTENKCEEKEMILSIGEILADMIGDETESGLCFSAFCGGAPFNVAVNAKQAGAKVGFIGRVGRDPIGKFLLDFSRKAGFDYLDIQTDEVRNTTLAFVTLTNGERDFAFFRHETADFNMNESEVDLKKYDGLQIVHLGSLMLSEERGRSFAKEIVRKVRAAKKQLSFDVNFRMDLYGSLADAIAAYQPFVEEADILKFSEDEITAYTGKGNLDDAIAAMSRKDRLLLVTLGSEGSMYVYNGETGIVPTGKVTPVDTTGAGDAFFGTVLAVLDGKEFTKENIELALKKGNEAGAKATQFKGAIKL